MRSSLSRIASLGLKSDQTRSCYLLTTTYSRSVLQMLHFESSISKRMRKTHLWQTFLWLHLPIAKSLILLKHRIQCSLSVRSISSEISDWIRGLAPYFADCGGCLYWNFYFASTIILNVKSSCNFGKTNHPSTPIQTFWIIVLRKGVLCKGRRVSWGKFILVWRVSAETYRKNWL